jgi:hypothetical protein
MSSPVNKPSPYQLWLQSCDEHGRGTIQQEKRYFELMVEQGYIIKRAPGHVESLPCGNPKVTDPSSTQ